MIANNYLEIYTLMFAWNLYEAIWDVLVGSGLALLPFIGAVIANFRDNYENGDAQSAIRQLEINIAGMILVMMLCVIPYRGFTIELETVRYDMEIPDCNMPANTEGDGDNTGTEYDNTFADMNGLDVHKPVAWSMVEFISSALTHSTIKSMSCVNNYEFMLMRIAQIEITDKELRERVRDYHEVCYKKAMERYEVNPIALPVNISQVEDIDWIGSRVLLNTVDEYYRHEEAYMTNMDKFNFSRMAAVRDSDAAREAGAHPYCHEVWSGERAPGNAAGLRQLLLDHIPVDDAGDILEDWKDWGSQVMTQGVVDEATQEDLILKMVLQAHAANLSSATDIDMSNDFDANKSWWSSAFDKLIAAGGLFTTIDEFMQANAMRQMMKVAGPMILALVQMVIIMAAPFVMVLGKYKLPTFISVALVYFTFEFINAIWAAAFWFDQRILDLYISQAGWFDVATNSFLVGATSTLAIILLPTVWMSVMAYAGAGMVRGMGIGGVGGGRAAGAGFMTGAHRGAGRAATSGAKSGISKTSK